MQETKAAKDAAAAGGGKKKDKNKKKKAAAAKAVTRGATSDIEGEEDEKVEDERAKDDEGAEASVGAGIDVVDLVVSFKLSCFAKLF